MEKENLERQFSKPLLNWFDVHGRKNLPWQSGKNPYCIWVSEVMLQQTQVQTVIPYFKRFIEQFHTVHELAKASDDDVLAQWSGLGYYTRARNLHETAKIICSEHQGHFPKDLKALIRLPGIGQSTAAAILSQAYDLPTAILDGNVKRVIARYFRIQGIPEQAKIKKVFWEKANLCMPEHRCAEYTQAIMDLGATCCTSKKPDCLNCPLQKNCLAYQHQEQLLYPTKKTKKPVPLQQQQFLVLQNQDNHIYLEKRPSSGLWGGLWCLPALDLHCCPVTYLHDQYGFHAEIIIKMPSFKHQFSHFHLKIFPITIKIQNKKNNTHQTPGRWLSPTEFASLGLSKPTQKIMNKLFESQESQ